jgi:dTMP kinase
MEFFLTFEGIEGCGKSTQASRIRDHLAAAGKAVVLTREPGGTPSTQRIRSLLADRENTFDPLAELLLFLADRAQHVATVIAPSLAEGRIVVCDRYCDSTLAYQGYGRGHDLAWLEQLNALASRAVVPDLTLWIDCPVDVGLGRVERRAGGPGDRFEVEPLEFHTRIRNGFAELAKRFSDRIVRIDGDRDADDVTADCIRAVDARLEAKHAAALHGSSGQASLTVRAGS